MEILYMWIEKYNNVIEKQGFNFGGEYIFHFNGSELTYKKNENYISGFYGNSIKNITGIIGENGSGKTSILELIIRNCKCQC